LPENTALATMIRDGALIPPADRTSVLEAATRCCSSPVALVENQAGAPCARRNDTASLIRNRPTPLINSHRTELRPIEFADAREVNTHMIDLTPACKRTRRRIDDVTDEHVSGLTPCQKLSLRDLVSHVGGLALAFTAAARKEFGELTDTPPVEGVPARRPTGAPHTPARLAELAAAWREPTAWGGHVAYRVGVDFPGEVAGIVALTEVVIHGWDVAAATRTGIRDRPGHLGRGARRT